MATTEEGGEGMPLRTRRSLISRLRNWRDDASWRAFFDSYSRLIYTVARRAGLRDDEAADVVQETLVSVARQMPGFRYDSSTGSFKGWLLQITRRRIIDHQRKRGRDPARLGAAGTVGGAMLEAMPDEGGMDLDRLWEVEWGRGLLVGALQALRREVDPKHYQIFDCYVMKEWPVGDVVRTFKVSPGQVYLVKHRLSERLKKLLTEAEQGERVSGDPSEGSEVP